MIISKRFMELDISLKQTSKVKLISKSILYYLFISLPLLMIACLISYSLIKMELRDGTDESLLREKVVAERLISSDTNVSSKGGFRDDLFTIRRVSFHPTGSFINDTVLIENIGHERVYYRMCKSYFNIKGTCFLIQILKPTVEEEELMEGLISSLFLVIFFLLISFLIVHWIVSKWLWRPFDKTIALLNTFDLRSFNRPSFPSSSIMEFNLLNETLEKMTNKMYQDFLKQKEFTENASHEIQTPLAVIKSKIELLIQSENLKEAEMHQIQTIETAANKLSALNKALLLLVRIDNYQIKDVQEFSVSSLVDKTLFYYEDLITCKQIKVNVRLEEMLCLRMDKELCYILLSNLMQNAIRHNSENGSIHITLRKNLFEIANTGEVLQMNPEELFDRFKKNSSSKDSLGIGLAIVKSICDLFQIQIHYQYRAGMHVFTCIFPEKYGCGKG